MRITDFQDSFQGFDFSVKKVTPLGVHPNTTIVYVHSQAASYQLGKPRSICEIAMSLGWGFCRYELAGHANKMEKYEQADCNIWVDQLIYVLNKYTYNRVIIVGYCLGGVIGLVAASKVPNKVAGVIALNSADIDWKEKLSATQLAELEQYGYTQHHITKRNIPFKLTAQFISSTENIRKDITLSCPVYLFLEQKDQMIKLEDVLSLQKKITSPKTIVKLISSSTHNMRNSASMEELFYSLQTF